MSNDTAAPPRVFEVWDIKRRPRKGELLERAKRLSQLLRASDPAQQAQGHLLLASCPTVQFFAYLYLLGWEAQAKTTWRTDTLDMQKAIQWRPDALTRPCAVGAFSVWVLSCSIPMKVVLQMGSSHAHNDYARSQTLYNIRQAEINGLSEVGAICPALP